MVNRAAEWNSGLAEDLSNPGFAQEFILAALEEGMTLQQILGKVIRAHGIKEFSKKARMPGSNIVRAINKGANPTQTTLNRLLKPFGLQLSVAKIVKAA